MGYFLDSRVNRRWGEAVVGELSQSWAQCYTLQNNTWVVHLKPEATLHTQQIWKFVASLSCMCNEILSLKKKNKNNEEKGR